MDANDLMEHYQSENHREKVKSLGVSGNMLAAMGNFGGAGGSEVVSSGEADFGGGEVVETAAGLSDEALIRSISESDAFQVALAGGGVNWTLMNYELNWTELWTLLYI